MRMVHYYGLLAALLVPALGLTLWSGLEHDASQRHLAIGFLTAILCVATQTLLILFMIVTGRVLKAAMKVRPLDRAYLDELNAFFARHRGYPVAVAGAFLATATAVLGYGSYIGVPPAVHMLLGLATVLLNLWAVRLGVHTMRMNQALLDRVRGALDAIDRELGPAAPEEGEVEWALGPVARRLVYAFSAWLPYLYWGLVVWRGDFARVPGWLPLTSAALFLLLLASALVAGRGPRADAPERSYSLEPSASPPVGESGTGSGSSRRSSSATRSATSR